MNEPDPCLYIFIDESGNRDFSKNGTGYWIITSLTTESVEQGILELHQLKHTLIGNGLDIECFHASEDRQAVRDKVFDVLRRLRGIRVDSVVVRKRMLEPVLRPMTNLYPKMLQDLLQNLFDSPDLDIRKFGRVVIFFDRAGSRRTEKEELVKVIKHYINLRFKGIPYQICMHQSASHPYLQMVDYFSWALYVKWERSEARPYDAISHLVRSELDVLKDCLVEWY